MTKSHLLATFAASTLLASAAIAQTTSPSGSMPDMTAPTTDTTPANPDDPNAPMSAPMPGADNMPSDTTVQQPNSSTQMPQGSMPMAGPGTRAPAATTMPRAGMRGRRGATARGNMGASGNMGSDMASGDTSNYPVCSATVTDSCIQPRAAGLGYGHWPSNRRHGRPARPSH